MNTNVYLSESRNVAITDSSTVDRSNNTDYGETSTPTVSGTVSDAHTTTDANSNKSTGTDINTGTTPTTVMDNGFTGVIPAGTRMVARSRFLVDPSKVLEHNAWDDVDWDNEHFDYARKRVREQAMYPVAEEAKETYEREAGKNWDEFYGRHNNKFFKDRQWLYTEFPELFQISQERVDNGDKLRVLEVGCGVGNTVFPLLQTNPECFVYACDISQTAVSILKDHERYDDSRCLGFVCDISNPEHVIPIPEGTLDIITMIFVLSAVQPLKFTTALARAVTLLKPGGLLLFRDYGEYDMSQLRFKRGKFAGSGENELAYVRGDGTRTYYFSKGELETLSDGVGMDSVDVKYDKRLIVNRKTEQKMYRNWVQARFRKRNSSTSSMAKNSS
eukprot:CFRG4607T1